MTIRGFAVVPFLALLAACSGGSGVSSVLGDTQRSTDHRVASPAKNPGNSIAWTPAAITLRGGRPAYSTLTTTAGILYSQQNLCGNAIVYQRTQELTREFLEYQTFEFIKNARGPITCTITDTLLDGSKQEPTATLTVTIK
jgi:hypothetical protein